MTKFTPNQYMKIIQHTFYALFTGQIVKNPMHLSKIANTKFILNQCSLTNCTPKNHIKLGNT